MDKQAPPQPLQVLQDIEAIRQLKFRYLNACDEKPPEEVAACFISGPIALEFGHIGHFTSRENFVATFVALGCHDHIVDMHHAQNPIIEITGTDTARAKIGLVFYSINTRDKTSVQLGGHYLDAYQRVDDQWYISASQFVVHSVMIKDFSEGAEVVTYAGNRMPETALTWSGNQPQTRESN
jgi:hypothetical protein